MMRNYLCWNPGAVRQVINPYAEHISDGLFRAVHTDWDLKVSPPVGKSFQEIREASWSDMTPAQFLDDFLRTDRQHALAAILGETGSGKSHLVHWMRLTMRPDPSRVVLVVRKTGTSLRAIVRMIIDELPPDQRGSFLETLQSAGDGTQSRSDQKQQLLNDLAQAIREEVLPPDADEVEQELSNCLPDLFQDPHMRRAHLLGDDTVVAVIVDHIFAPSNARDRPDQRRSFVEADLPLGGLDFAHASRLAQNAIEVIELDRPVNLPLAVKVINRNLDRAVARTLSFSGDRIEELMTRLRIYLKGEGKELILLVEEFARLQGIDRALLQAITSQGDDRLCRMRTAIAVSTGFFESVAETAYMRTTHIVDMNRSAGRAEGQRVTPASLSHFTARYLNAVRLGRDAITAWNDTAISGESPPSACASCRYQTECHAVFGAIDDYGLYPFTARALWNAASRVDEDGMPDRINPRILQNDLLVEVLDNFGPDIATGSFPSAKLIEKLGGRSNLPAVIETDLQNRNPQNFSRWAAFLDLYDGTGKLANLDQRLRNAFDVPEIPDVNELAEDLQIDGPAPPTPEIRPAGSRDDMLIEEWIKGTGLDETVATTLRLHVFSAVSNAIDWDMLGLAKASFAGKTGRPFQTRSISFDRQTTQVRPDYQVRLVIPGDLIQPARAAAALQGVLRASKEQFRWEFDNGDKMLAAFLDCVEVWARSVETQLRMFCAPSPTWNQGAAAVELLCVGAAIGGRIKPDATIAEMIDGTFNANWPAESASMASEMRLLYGKLLRNREKLATIAHAQMSSTKGGRAGAMLNPSRIIGPIRGIRVAKYELRQKPPAGDAQELAKIYREVRDALPEAAEAERCARQAWLAEVDQAFGEAASRATIFAALDTARKTVAEAGINTQNTGQRLAEALNRFKIVYFDDTVSAARALGKDGDAVAALPQFGRSRRNAVEAGSALILAAEAFLAAVDAKVGADAESVDAKHSALAASLVKIDTSLAAIDANLKALSSFPSEQADAA